jgi:Bacteriophage head to tail connecting protein.
MYVAELPNSILFQSRALNECFPTENSKGQIDTMYRLFEYSAQQAVQEWGDKVKGIPQIEEAVDKKKDTRFEFLHCVKPNVDYGRGGIRGRTRWRGEYIFLPTKETIDESRFHEFPFIFPRWARIAGEVFGYGPAMTVLPDIKMVNAMMKTIIKAAQKIVDPPLQVPDDTFLHTIRMTPSALNFYRSGANDRIEPIETKGRPDIGLEMVQNIQGKIERAFHTDLLEMPEEKNEGSRVAATWVMQRRQEKMRLMAPMLSRMQTEFLGNLIDRVFNIMLRKKAFLPVPPSLSGARLKPVYVSPVAKAQRAQEAEGLLNLFNLMQPIAPLDPSAMKILKGDEVMRFAGDIYSVPTRLFRSREEMQQMKEEQAQVDRNGIMAQNVVEGAGAAKDAASAVKDIASVQQGQPK